MQHPLSNEYDKFLKDIREMSNRDWLIEKKLVEAGGIGRKIYLHIGRGHGKTFTLLNHIKELRAKGKEVHIVDYRDSSPKPNRDAIERIKECIIDLDLCPLNPIRQVQHEFFDEFLKRPIKLDFESRYLGEWYYQEPTWAVRPDGSLKIRDISIMRREEG